VLVTLRILRPVRDNPSALVPDWESAGLRALTEVADLDNRTVLGFATKTGKARPAKQSGKTHKAVLTAEFRFSWRRRLEDRGGGIIK
jgi:hypothetical protein